VTPTPAAAVIRVRTSDRTTVVELADPKRRNALGPEMVAALSRALTEADTDPAVRAVVLSADGPHFCAGGDIKVFDLDVARGRDYVYATVGLFRQIEQLRKPVIAAVRGYALGGGFELALACDVVIASRSASFGLPELAVGAIPGFALARLSEIAGRGFCKRLAWSQERIGADEAYMRSIVTEVVDDTDLESAALAWAARIGALPRVAAESVKASANREIADRTLFETATSAAVLWGTQGIAEGRQAFFERRPPVFPEE
jgi:enoyl-CoA hydratase/carnithine racemase